MQNENFILEQQRAVERMMEMSRKSSNTQKANISAPPFVKPNNNPNTKAEASPKKPEADNGNFRLPLLENIKLNRDTTLILGLILLLYSEKADRLLMLALLYILL